MQVRILPRVPDFVLVCALEALLAMYRTCNAVNPAQIRARAPVLVSYGVCSVMVARRSVKAEVLGSIPVDHPK